MLKNLFSPAKKFSLTFFILFGVILDFFLKHKFQSFVSSDIPPTPLSCPYCGSLHTVKNGSTRHHKPKRLCRACQRQFTVDPSQPPVSQEIKNLIDKLLLERISLCGVTRATQVLVSL